MSERLLKVLPLGVFGSLIVVLTTGFSPAQEPIPLVPPGQPVPVPGFTPAQPDPVPLPLPGQPGYPAAPAQPDPKAQPDQGDGVEVLAKGPVHEGFATTAEAPTASPVVAKQPPEPIEELPPDQKPAGENVQWIPGYWHWDEETNKFIWISGFWRQPPPGRVWVPGSWREAQGGWQWVGGFWQNVQPEPAAQPNQQVQPQIEYLEQPPENIEVGPTVPAPSETHFYVPGSWVWRGRYVWRPGVWVEHRTNWLWVPSRYHWTPAGYVFCDGYWDYPLATRGVLFAPVAFVRPIRPAFVYTPVYVVSEPCMVGALFVRRGHGHYYFGDYFDRGYGARGYSAWCGTYSRGGFSVGFGTGRSWGYDPLWSYYSVSFRSTPTWHRGVGDLYHGRYRGDLVRPPTTLVQQNRTINNITNVNVTNVTNNITVNNGVTTVNNRDVSNVAMVAPLRAAPDLQRTKFEAVSADARRNEAVAARQLRDVATQRTRLEKAAVAQPAPAAVRPAPGQPAVAAQQPRSIKLDVPKTAVARAQVNDEKKAPPPNPIRPATSGPAAKIDAPRVEPKSPGRPANPVVGAQPRVDPKLPGVNPQPGPTPKVNPQPIVAPKVGPKVNPQPGPTVTPKVNPQPPVVAPRVNPQPSVNPLPKIDAPRVDPKPPVVAPKVNPQPVAPKVELPKVSPQPPVVPKVDPPRVNPQPRFDPPKVNPLPANPPRVDPKPFTPPSNPAPRVNPQPAPANPPRFVPAPKVQPKADPKPTAAAPPVQQPRPAPVVVAPKVQLPKAPVVQPRTAPAFNPPAQPRPAAIAPAAQPPRFVQPPKAQPPSVAPRAQPAPVGRPPAKGKR